ncbi:hypothetical protein PENTCL1PPCAC_33, partial [Pristionchus entomophagus]
VYAMELNCLEMLMRSFHSLFSTRAFASARKCIAVERVGRRGDVALVSIADPSLGDIPHEICEILVAHDSDVSIRSTIVALTSSLTSLPLKSYGSFSKIANCTKPTIALVDGEISGVATELAMSCDVIYASDRSSFALNQIRLGSMPGSGGTQRLPRAVGKSVAMEMVLAGEPLSAADAKQSGLVSKVLPIQRLHKEGIRLGDRAGEKSALIQPMAKEAVNAAFETTLREGLLLESRLFEATFATRDRKEGMTAHVERRRPEWRGE